MNNKISMIGGDSRQLYAAGYLIEKGYEINVFAAEHGLLPEGAKKSDSLTQAMKSEIILLPLPVSKNGNLLNTPLSSAEIRLRDITDEIKDHHKIFYGMGNLAFTKQVDAKAKFSCDYFTIESLIYKNALLTSEGIISIILDKLPVTVFGLKTAVTGFGRIGYFTTEKLLKLGADVTVFARNELQLIKAETLGAKAHKISEINNYIADFDCIINTVPADIINKEHIQKSKKDCIFIESASAPYGIDSNSCSEYGRTLIKAFSLPGKTAPKSAGIIIGETIDACLKEVK